MNTKAVKFGTTCEISPDFVKKLGALGLIDLVVKNAQFKEQSGLKATDGKKTSTLGLIPKLDDAKWAGTRKSKDTTLILTEGDSAKAFAMHIYDGNREMRNKIGIFPLRGKALNVRKATPKTIKDNVEFCILKKILGLKQDVIYTDVSKLRYGRIMIMADSDVDGSHIKALVMNMIQFFWPELLSEVEGFITTVATPLLKVTKKGKSTETKSFPSQQAYDEWVKDVGNDISKWMKPKYYKGLGTSTQKEAREIWKTHEDRVVQYIWEKPKSDDEDDKDDKDDKSTSSKKKKKTKKVKMVSRSDANPKVANSQSYKSMVRSFDDECVDDRKVWLSGYDKNASLSYTKKKIPYSDFFNKELIHFSNEDNIRSIPSVIDGNKPSQRKILHGLYSVKKGEIKVAQLASHVAGGTAYKHGEASLQGAIINMAQGYIGANNIYLLHPQGEFGTRCEAGKDAASPRYIYTFMEPIMPYIYRKEDLPILTTVYDEGEPVEPEIYLPILPMILVNGASGIGTGWSTDVPSYNPIDIGKNLKLKLKGKKMNGMVPWYHGYTGKIEATDDPYKFKVSGTYEILDGNTVRVTEIPIHTPITKYYETLKAVEADENGFFESITPYGDTATPDYEIVFGGTRLQKILKRRSGTEDLEKMLKLTSTISTTNMHAYDENNVLTKYDTPLDIINAYFDYRLKMYEVRRKNHIKILSNELKMIKNKVKFVTEIAVDKTYSISNKKKDVIYKELETRGYDKLSAKKVKNVETNNDEDDSEKKSIKDEETKDYQYLTSMQVLSLTSEKIDDLNREYKNKKKEYDDYSSTTASQLWERELDEFLEYYVEKWIPARKIEEEIENNNGAKKKKGKKSSKSKKDESDDEE